MDPRPPAGLRYARSEEPAYRREPVLAATPIGGKPDSLPAVIHVHQIVAAWRAGVNDEPLCYISVSAPLRARSRWVRIPAPHHFVPGGRCVTNARLHHFRAWVRCATSRLLHHFGPYDRLRQGAPDAGRLCY